MFLKTLRPLLILGALAAALGLGLVLSRHTFGNFEKEATDTVPIGGPFTLHTPDGETMTQASFPGKYLFIYFGYTFCPDICPTGLLHIKNALQKLPPQTREKVQAIFITLDPARDTPQLLQRFMQDYPGIVALTGTEAEVQGAVDAYKVYAAKRFHDGNTQDPYYLMDHSSLVYLMSPDGRYLAHATHATPSDEMVHLLTNHIG